jgi:sugar porter (SP) family MFS transporter
MSEIAPRKVRGAIVAGYQFCITIGILLANCVVYSTQERRDTGSYRIPIAVQFLWALILGIGLALLPESPRFWVKKGKLDKAAAALARVRGQPVDSEYIQDELAEIIANHEYEMSIVPQTSYLGSWMSCFEGKITSPSSNVRRTVLGIVMQMMQQLTGINFIFYFGTVFFQQLGTISNPFLISLVTTLVNVLTTPFSFVMVEKIGRRTILIWGAAAMVVMQFIVAIIGATAGKDTPDHPANPHATRAMIAFICLNIASFATTWGPAAWIVIGEIFPLTIRSRGVGLSTASNWFWNCIIGVITPYLVADQKNSAKLGSNVFFMWGGLCCISFLFAYCECRPLSPYDYPKDFAHVLILSLRPRDQGSYARTGRQDVGGDYASHEPQVEAAYYLRRGDASHGEACRGGCWRRREIVVSKSDECSRGWGNGTRYCGSVCSVWMSGLMFSTHSWHRTAGNIIN